jgi:single-strand DNA-binding protein
MANINVATLSGNLTKDPVTKTVGDYLVSSFSMAQNSLRKDAEGNYLPDFFNIECWGKIAEFAQKYLVKGTKVHISGRLTTQTYTNKEGVEVTKMIISANTIDADFAKKGEGTSTAQSKKTANVSEELLEDDLPF